MDWNEDDTRGQFPRLKDPLQLEDFGERKVVVITLMILLHNYQTSKVAMNQILNTFMSKTKGFESNDGESNEQAALRGRYTEATTLWNSDPLFKLVLLKQPKLKYYSMMTHPALVIADSCVLQQF